MIYTPSLSRCNFAPTEFPSLPPAVIFNPLDSPSSSPVVILHSPDSPEGPNEGGSCRRFTSLREYLHPADEPGSLHKERRIPDCGTDRAPLHSGMRVTRVGIYMTAQFRLSFAIVGGMVWSNLCTRDLLATLNLCVYSIEFKADMNKNRTKLSG